MRSHAGAWERDKNILIFGGGGAAKGTYSSGKGGCFLAALSP